MAFADDIVLVAQTASGLRELMDQVTVSLAQTGLLQLSRAPLKPQQRIFILIKHLIPRLTHRLVLGRVYRTQLWRMDERMWVVARSSLRLPHDTPSSLLHTSVAEGGIGITSLKVLIPLMKQKRIERMAISDDCTALAALTSSTLIKDQRYWAGPVRLNNAECRTKEECKGEWPEQRQTLLMGKD